MQPVYPLQQVPTPGWAGGGVPAVAGVATCRNLASMSPPTLLEEFEIYSYSIGWGLATPGEIPAGLDLELQLLINDRTAWVDDEPVPASAVTPSVANGTFRSDLVNPIRVGARDRLTLRIGLPQPALTSVTVVLGAQMNPAGNGISPYESTVSYNVIDLPASRRL
jgi:hypothetical protein